MDYISKSYGRNDEVADIYRLFKARIDISMPGPRRLGKSFLLDRLVEAGAAQTDADSPNGWTAIRIEVAGCKSTQEFFRSVCTKINSQRSPTQNATGLLLQRIGQAVNPRSEQNGPWYQPLTTLDHETYFERLITTMHEDKHHRWALLIDELPIFLKALHDQGEKGIQDARNFMNNVSRLRVDYPNVRWLITGSIGLEPLARIGNYMGVLVKFQTYLLAPLSPEQAREFIIDVAATGRLLYRTNITAQEADAIIQAVGWRSAYYLEAVATKLAGQPSEDIRTAESVVEAAIEKLLHPSEMATFGVWEEHLRKHYIEPERMIAFSILQTLAPHPQGVGIDTLLSSVRQPALTKASLRILLMRLDAEGFVHIDNWESDNPKAAFRNVLLRRWWQRFTPKVST